MASKRHLVLGPGKQIPGHGILPRTLVPPCPPRGPHLIRSESEGWGMWCQAASSMACWYSCSLVRGTGPSGHTPSDSGMFTSDSWRGGWAEGGGAAVLLMMRSVGTGQPRPGVRLGRASPPVGARHARTLTSLGQVQCGHRVLDAGADGCPLCHGLQRAQRLGGLGRRGAWPQARAGGGTRAEVLALSPALVGGQLSQGC